MPVILTKSVVNRQFFLAYKRMLLYNDFNKLKEVFVLKTKKSLKISLAVINISVIVLFALAIALPWLVTWFVEVRHKDGGLPAVVMLTCYPSLPFAVGALFNIRKLLKNCLGGLIFGDKNISCLKKICMCCLAGSIITFAAGFFYLPFFVVSIAAAGCALIVKVIKDLFAAELELRREELYETVREEL